MTGHVAMLAQRAGHSIFDLYCGLPLVVSAFQVSSEAELTVEVAAPPSGAASAMESRVWSYQTSIWSRD